MRFLCLLLVLLSALCGAAETLVIPGCIDEIEAEAFADCAFDEVFLPESLLFIADDALPPLARVTAPEGSFAWDWAVRLGLTEKTPFAASAKKDFASFAAAREMVDTECQTDWTGAGRIRYVEQFGGARTYVPQYWVSASDASGSCTRAAGSMAASYMGINALPRAAADFTKFQTYIKNQGCAVQTDSSCSLATFISWYDDYARDAVGQVSPVVIFTKYGSSQHAFVVIGRDKSAHDVFYVADSGSSSYVNRVTLGVEDGRIYVARYELSTGKTDARYGKEHPMLYTWRYKKK